MWTDPFEVPIWLSVQPFSSQVWPHILHLVKFAPTISGRSNNAAIKKRRSDDSIAPIVNWNSWWLLKNEKDLAVTWMWLCFSRVYNTVQCTVQFDSNTIEIISGWKQNNDPQTWRESVLLCNTLLTVFAWFIFCTSDRTKVLAQARSARASAFRDGYACMKKPCKYCSKLTGTQNERWSRVLY